MWLQQTGSIARKTASPRASTGVDAVADVLASVAWPMLTHAAFSVADTPRLPTAMTTLRTARLLRHPVPKDAMRWRRCYATRGPRPGCRPPEGQGKCPCILMRKKSSHCHSHVESSLGRSPGGAAPPLVPAGCLHPGRPPGRRRCRLVVCSPVNRPSINNFPFVQN